MPRYVDFLKKGSPIWGLPKISIVVDEKYFVQINKRKKGL
jgi:hypothetical protein